MLKYIIDSGNSYLKTPVYSPNNNPIEYTFSVIKKEYKKNYKNDKSTKLNIVNNIKKTVSNFNDTYKNKLINFFTRAINYDYINIEKELRYRIVFSNTKNA